MNELNELYQRIKNGKSTVADKQRFVELLAMPENETLAKELLNDYALYAETLEHIESPAPERLKIIGESIVLADTEQDTTYTRPAHRIHFLKTAWFRYAAVFILAIGVAIYFLNRKSESPNTVVAHNVIKEDIMPGGTRAKLTLSNGKQIELNDAAPKTIIDGDLNIDNNNGELSYTNAVSSTYNTMSTEKGGQYKLTLADGTKVWLNAASSITYPTSFTGNTREVHITGEVYMEVNKNAKKPLIVKTKNGAEIDVLGTSFNVNTYGDEAAISTTLLQGSVRVKEKNNAVVLNPGEQANINIPGAANNIKVQRADIEKVMAWKNGLFNFEGAELQTVMQQLSRWYDVEIIYKGEKPVKYFEGKMDRWLTLAQVVKILGETKINFEIQKGKLIVSK